MHSHTRRTVLAAIAILAVALTAMPQSARAQRGIGKDKLELVQKGTIAFKPYAAGDFHKGATEADLKKEITLPNKKKMPLEKYVSTMNLIERRLASAGLTSRGKDATSLLARVSKGNVLAKKPAVQSSAKKLAPADVRKRFTANELPIPKTQFSSVSIATMTPQKVQAFSKQSAKKITGSFKGLTLVDKGIGDKLKNLKPKPEKIDHSFAPEPWQGEIAGYGARIGFSLSITGTAFEFDGEPSMAAIKATESEFAMGMSVQAAMKLPADLSVSLPVIGSLGVGSGYLDLYRFETAFKTKANQGMSAKAFVKVVDQLIIDEDKPSLTGDTYNFEKSRNVPVMRQKIGGMDMYSYMMDMMVPIEVYWGIEAGGAVDVHMDRAGIQGEMGPRITQSITIEWGLAADVLENLVDAGVGGKLDVIAVNFELGGTVGLHWGGGSVILKDDVYADADIQLLRGRLYTFYKYPKFVCDNIFLQGLDVNCWAIKRVEDDIVDTGALVRFQQVLYDDDNSKTLDW